MNVIASDLLGLGAAALVVSRIAGLQLPVITTDRAALVALTVLGFAMCSVAGATRAIGPLGFAHPLTIVGTILGVAVLGIVGIAIAGSVAAIDDRVAFFAVAGLIALKWVIDLVYATTVGFPTSALGA